MQGLFFPLSARGREGRFKPVGSERGTPERQPELWMHWGGVFVQLTKGTLSSSRGQQVKYSLSLPCPMLIIHLLFFWQIPNHMTKINQYSSLDSFGDSWLAFQEAPQCSSNSHANLQPSTLSNCFSSHFWRGGKTWYTTLLGFFVVFIKFFKISQNYTH